MDYLAFLEGREADDHGRTFAEILAYGKVRLELCHDYIQEVFPTMEPSRHAAIRPLSPEEAYAIRRSEAALENVRRMYGKMLEFWRLDDGAYLEWGRGAKRRHWDKKCNHNHLRMTRVAQSLALLGMDAEHKDFCMRLRHILAAGARVSKRTEKIWREQILRGKSASP